jgi:quercetin dioxygenase-like cupin family protein
MFRLFKKQRLLEEPDCQIKGEGIERLDRLKELGDMLDLKNYTVPQENGSLLLQLDDGNTGHATNLLHTRDVAVAHINFPVAGRMGCHNHAEIEHVLCYAGRAVLSFKDKSKVELEPGQMHTIPPEIAHDIVVEDDTRLITLTVPQSPDYPRG